jgi:hypothetical protein
LDETRTPATPPAAGEGAAAPCPGRARSLAFQLAAVALTVVSALAGTGLARWLRAPAVEDAPAAVTFPNRLFQGWTKPDLVLVLTAQELGYLLPCGCSEPQIGGLERRYNFLQMIKAAGWPSVAVDLGDIAQRHAPAGLPNQQALIKYRYSMQSLKAMGYGAVSFGESEVNLGLSSVLDEHALNDPVPRVVMSNLVEADKNYPGETGPWELLAAGGKNGLKVGVTARVGPVMEAKFKALTRDDKKLQFENSVKGMNKILAGMAAAKVDIPVLLYQGVVGKPAGAGKRATEATGFAEAFPQIPIVLCVCEEDDPPARPVEVHTTRGVTLVITLGRKCKFVGVVGVWKTGNPAQPFTFKYERAEMTEDFKTKAGETKGHPIRELLEAYTRELRDKSYLEKYGQVRHALQVMPEVKGLRRAGPVEYVGSEKCKSCHQHAYDIWKTTPHSHAYAALEDKEKKNPPSNRQFDPECIVCHTVGFGYQTGYVNEQRTPKLKNVGCEACHGPASRHVFNPEDAEWHKRINPWKYLPAAKRAEATDQFCQKCHDIDNDVTWLNGAFQRKWPKIEHNTPQQQPVAAPGEKPPEEK